MKYSIFLILLAISSCNIDSTKNPNNMGLVTYLPKGEYTIWNYGSRHIVKCVDSHGKIYLLNDGDFSKNGIKGYDAHQYRNKTKIVIK